MKLVIAGGGTGGHLFPGIAVAEALMSIDTSAEVLFVGTERGIESRAVPKAGFPISFIQIGGLKRVGIKQTLQTLLDLPLSILHSRKILREFGAEAVLGVGGYASGPVLLAAKTLGLPTAICEQNSVPGLTNRVLGKLVRRVFGSFLSSAAYFPPKTFSLVGNPVRRAFLDAAMTRGEGHDPNLVFVFGGSQGARVLNEVVPLAVSLLVNDGMPIRVLHQAGRTDVDVVRGRYQDAGVDADVTPFIDDMVSAYRSANVVICRAGATSCAEITALGVPSILVPFPFAADDHQSKNAQDLVARDAAIVVPQVELTPERLADELRRLHAEPATRQAIASAAQAMGRLNAAEVVARSAGSGFRDEDASAALLSGDNP